MDYKLFDEFITLQALLKELGIIQSGGAIKSYLAQTTVLFNGQDEKRRGKKIRIGDVIVIPNENLTIMIIAPSEVEKAEHAENLAEKARVTAIVKKLNQENRKSKQLKKSEKTSKSKQNKVRQKDDKPRFPGT